MLNYPDYVVFDIDPYIYSGKEAPGDEPELNTVAFEKGKEVAFWLRELLHSMSLEPIVKTSGKTGLHVFVPIRRTLDFDAARAGLRAGRAAPDAAAPEGHHAGVERAQAHRQDLHGLQHERARQDAERRLFAARRSRRAGVDAAHLGRAGRRAPARLPDHQRGERLAKTGDRWRDALKAKQSLERAAQARAEQADSVRLELQSEGRHGCTIDCDRLTLRFGLVSIPVKLLFGHRGEPGDLLQPAAQGLRLAPEAAVPLLKEEVPVAREDMVKGYEFAKDQYVMFTPEELKALEEAGTQTAEITEFVPIEAIDPVYFDKAYYLAPDKGGAKPYALLARRCANRSAARSAAGPRAASSTS